MTDLNFEVYVEVFIRINLMGILDKKRIRKYQRGYHNCSAQSFLRPRWSPRHQTSPFINLHQLRRQTNGKLTDLKFEVYVEVFYAYFLMGILDKIRIRK